MKKIKIGERSFRYQTATVVKWYRNINGKNYKFTKTYYNMSQPEEFVEFCIWRNGTLVHRINEVDY